MGRFPGAIRFVVTSLAAGLLAGCGGSSSSKSDLQHAVDSLSGLACQSYVACNCMNAALLDDCKSEYGGYLSLELSSMLASSPGATLDLARLDACVADMRSALAACPVNGNLMGNIASCGGGRGGLSFIVGTQPQGAPCAEDISCAPGFACDTVLGTCEAEAQATQSCATVLCVDGLRCDGSETCVALGAVDGSCSSNEYCQSGLICSPAGKCSAPVSETGTCNRNDQCVPGTYCTATTCTAKKPGGAVCGNDYECQSDDCSGSSCTPANFCSTGLFN